MKIFTKNTAETVGTPGSHFVDLGEGRMSKNLLPSHLTDPSTHNPLAKDREDCFCSPLRTEVENLRILVHRNPAIREVRD